MSDLGMKFTLSPSLDVGALNYVLAQMKKSLGDAGSNIKMIDADEFNKGLDSIKQGFKETTESSDKLDESLQKPIKSSSALANAFKFNMVIDAVDKVSQAMTKLTDESIKYEASLKAVGAITGFTGKELDDIGDKARGLAKSFGGTATDQLSSFQGILSKIGPEVAKDSSALELFGKNINILSKASGDSAATSMQAITDTMLQMGLAIGEPIEIAQKSTDVINALAASAQVGAAEIPEVAESLVVAGVAAKGANIGLVDVNAAIQVLALGGKRGAEAGTALRNVIGYLQKASGPAAEVMQSLGTSTEELGELLTTQGLDVALAKIRDGMDTLGSDAEKNAALMRIFGMENAAAAGILIGNADKFKEFASGIELGMQGAGSAFEQAEIRMDTTQGMIDRMMANVSDFMIGMGSIVSGGIGAVINVSAQLAPMVTTFATLKSIIPVAQLSEFTNNLVSKFLPALVTQNVATKQLILSEYMLNFAKANGIATDGKSVAVVLAKAGAVKIATVAQWLWNTAMNANPIGALILGVTALVGVIALLSNAFSKSAKDREDDAKAESESIDKQIANYKKKENAVNAQKALISTYEELGTKASRTAEEEDKFMQVQIDLAKTMPGSISSTKSFSDNLATLKAKLNESTIEVDKFQNEIKKLEDRKVEVNIEIKKAQNEQITDDINDVFDSWTGFDAAAKATTNNFIEQMKLAQNSDELKKIGTDLKTAIYGNSEFKNIDAQDKANLEKLADATMVNLEEQFKLKREDAGNKIKDIINSAINSGSGELSLVTPIGDSNMIGQKLKDSLNVTANDIESELQKLSKANNIPIEDLRKMYSEMNSEVQKNRVGDAIKESLEIKGKINSSEQNKQLIDAYSDAMNEINNLRSKKSDSGLTVNEQNQLDELSKKAQETADKIGAIAPESKTNFKTIVDEAGNLKQVYDINIQKASELVEANKEIGNTEPQEKYINAITAQSVEIDKQKAKLYELKEKADQANDPKEKQKYIDLYNKENEAIKKNTNDLVTQLVKGKDAGLDISKSIDILANSLGITREEANRLLLAEKLREASKDGDITKDKIKEIANSFNVSESAAEKLYKQQQMNTKEALNTANAVASIENAYDNASAIAKDRLESNKMEYLNLSQTETERDLTEGEKRRKAELEKNARWDVGEVSKLNKLEEQANKVFSEKEKKTAKKTTEDIQKVIEKAEEEGRKKREELELRSIEDQEKQARERKIAGLKKTEDDILKQIEEAEKKKNEKLIKQLKENLSLQKQINEDELIKYDTEIAKKRMAEEDKNNKEIKSARTKYINDANKSALELLKNQSYSLVGDDYINNLNSQKDLATQIAEDEAKQKVNTLIESNKNIIKLYSELLEYRSIIASKTIALDNAIANNEVDEIKKLSADIDDLKSKSSNLLSDIDSTIDNIKESDEARSINIKVNYELDKSNDEIDEKIDKAKIAINAKSYADYSRKIALEEAERTYRAELALAQGNNNLKLEAEKKFQQEKLRLHMEYLDKSLDYEDVVLNAQYKFINTFTQSFMDTAINPIQQEINKLQDQLNAIRDYNKDGSNDQYNKDVEAFREASQVVN